jgi:hypothetical protein
MTPKQPNKGVPRRLNMPYLLDGKLQSRKAQMGSLRKIHF